jgi:hypothetical protein
LASGFCISTNANPTTTDLVLSDLGDDTLNAVASNLEANQLYPIRAFATNSEGTAYSNDVSFFTLALPIPSLVTSSVSLISYSYLHTPLNGGKNNRFYIV